MTIGTINFETLIGWGATFGNTHLRSSKLIEGAHNYPDVKIKRI